MATFPYEVRGATSVVRGGCEEWYAVAGDTVYYLAVDGDEHRPEAIGTLTTQSGDVDFLCYDGALLLLDGEDLYTLTPTKAKATEAYVPLYGREWQTGDVSTHVMYERPNLLTRRLRLQYRMSANGKTFPLRSLVPESLDAVWVNGERYTGSISYSQAAGMISTGKEQTEGSLVEVYLTMPEDGSRARVTRAGHMAAIDRAERARVMLYDVPQETGVWISRMPMDENARLVRGQIPDVCMLYVTEGDRVIIGDGVHRVTGAVRHYDRSLVFTARGTWMTKGEQNEDGTLCFIPVNTMLGCTSPGGSAVLGNRPITIHGARVLSWNSDTDERDECNATAVSTPVESLLNERHDAWRVFVDPVRGEAWVYSPGVKGRVFIYHADQNVWTTYDGFVPRALGLLGNKVGVSMNKTLYYFDEAATADTLVDDEHPDGIRVGIDVEYQSPFCDFGAPDRIKRLCRGTVVAACGTGSLTLTLQSVSGRRVDLLMEGDGQEVSVMQGRVSLGRFRFLRVGVRSDDDTPLQLHSIRLTSRPS